ncbi:MAG: hypothetical protein R8G60_15240 [Roseovarius pacificus]|nr:hypothetical protein [Roseovarius pacificus]
MSERVLPILNENGNLIPWAPFMVMGAMTFPEDRAAIRQFYSAMSIDPTPSKVTKPLLRKVREASNRGFAAGFVYSAACHLPNVTKEPSFLKAAAFVSSIVKKLKENPQEPWPGPANRNQVQSAFWEFRNVAHFWAGFSSLRAQLDRERCVDLDWVLILEDRAVFLDFLGHSESLRQELAKVLPKASPDPWVAPQALSLPKVQGGYRAIEPALRQFVENYKSSKSY